MLTGQAKKDYQREYMRKRRSNMRVVRPVRPDMLDPVQPDKAKRAELQEMIHRIELGAPPIHPPFVSRNDVPWYNKKIHKSGDVVRVERDGKITVEVVPELDAEGNIIM